MNTSTQSICRDCEQIATTNPYEMSHEALDAGAAGEILGIRLCPKHADLEARCRQAEEQESHLKCCIIACVMASGELMPEKPLPGDYTYASDKITRQFAKLEEENQRLKSSIDMSGAVLVPSVMTGNTEDPRSKELEQLRTALAQFVAILRGSETNGFLLSGPTYEKLAEAESLLKAGQPG